LLVLAVNVSGQHTASLMRTQYDELDNNKQH